MNRPEPSAPPHVRQTLPAVLVLLLSISAPAVAQTPGAILQGTVADEQGAVLPGASATIRNVETGLVRGLVTDASGWYRAVALPPGAYELQVELSGFAPAVRSGLTLTIGQEATVNVTLRLATVVETLTVMAASPLVEPTRSDIGTTITRSQLDNLPLAGRNFTNLAVLAPGVTGVGGGGINAGGQTTQNNTYLVDGLSHDNNIVAGTRGEYSLETVREFQVMANQFSAQYGQASGAIVNVVTRSGTNKISGRAFVFHRDDSFDAQDPFSKALGSGKAPFSQQQYGGFLGGPIVRDRLHYFGSYERVRTRETSVVTSPLVPASEREIPRKIDGHVPFLRLDWQLPRNHSLMVRYRRDFSELIGDGIGGLNTLERGLDIPRQYQDIVVSETAVLSNRAVNEVRFQFATRYNGFQKTYSPFETPDIRRPSGNFGKASNRGGYVDEDRYQINDNFSYSRGQHDLKAGVDISVIRGIDYFPRNLSGTFTFRTDRLFDPSDESTYPSLFTQTIADPATIDNNELYSVFVQDTWRVRTNLTLNIGVRYDADNAVGRATSFPSGLAEVGARYAKKVADDRNNVAPRLGIVWDPSGAGRTVVRGGFGLYYDQVFMNITGNVQYALRARDVTIVDPGYPDPYSRGSVGGLPSLQVVSPDYKTPYTRSLSLGVKREVVQGLAISADFVKSRGYNLYATRDINFAGSGVARKDAALLRVDQHESERNSRFTALLLGVERRTSGRGATLGVSYTLSRTERDTEGFGFTAQDPLNPAAENGLANNHRRHQLVANITWQLPGDVQLGALLQARSGIPWNVTTGGDNNGDTQFVDRPDLVDPNGDPRSKNTYFSGFSGRVGNLPRNSAIGPSFFALDLRVSKSFKLPQTRVEMFVEGFNLSNRVNYGSPTGNLRSSLFGQSTGLAGPPRQVEIGFRIDF